MALIREALEGVIKLDPLWVFLVSLDRARGELCWPYYEVLVKEALALLRPFFVKLKNNIFNSRVEQLL